MSAVQEQSLHSVRLLSQRAEKLWPLVLAAAVLVVAVPWQTRWGVNPDTSWLITLCERLLAGDRLYVDVMETNPPFSVWLYMPPVYLADRLGVAPEYLAHAYSYTICVFGLWFAGLIAQRARFVENPVLYRLMPVFLALLVLFPGNSFSEREGLGVALLLPLLVLMAWRAGDDGRAGDALRAGDDRPSEPQWWLAALAGLSGSVMVLVKPYYAVMILAPALYVAWRRRSIRPLFAIEYWVIGIACAVYLAAVLRLHPEFMRDIFPNLADTYMRYKEYTRVLYVYGASYLISICLFALLRRGRALSTLVAILAMASVAGIIPLIYQAKGWSYHAYPAVALILAAIMCRMAERSSGPGAVRANMAEKILLIAVVAVSWLPFKNTEKPDAALVASIRAVADHPSVGLIGQGIQAGHPLTRMIDGHWISAYCSDWFGAFAVIFAHQEREAGNLAEATRLKGIEHSYIEAKLRELNAAKPEVMILQKVDLFWTPYIMARNDFTSFMSGYRLLAENETVRVYLRKDLGKVAASN